MAGIDSGDAGVSLVDHKQAVRVLLAVGLVYFVVLYWPTLGHGFLGDDYRVIRLTERFAREATAHQTGQVLSGLASFPMPEFGYVRPLWGVLTLGEYLLFGWMPVGYHAISLVLFGLNMMMLYLLGRALSRPALGALASIMLVGMPNASYSVFWISQQSYLVAGAFSLSAVLLVLNGVRNRNRLASQTLLGAACFTAGILANEATLTLFVVVVYLSAVTRAISSAQKARIISVFLFAIVFALTYRFFVHGSFSLPKDPGAAGSMPLRYVATYMDLLVNSLLPLYSFRSVSLLLIALPIAVMTTALVFFAGVHRLRARRSSLGFKMALAFKEGHVAWVGAVWVLSTILILVPQGGSVRTLYVATLGMALLSAGVLSGLAGETKMYGIAFGILLILCGTLAACTIVGISTEFACVSSQPDATVMQVSCPPSTSLPYGWSCAPAQSEVECTPYMAFRWSIIRPIVVSVLH